MSEPLNQYIDLEAYDVVEGEHHRALEKAHRELQAEAASLRLALRLLRQRHEEMMHAAIHDPWPMPERTADPIPPDTWGD